jgi:hypothetical protein
VLVRSVSVEVLSGEWKIPGENQVNNLLFGIKKSSGMICDRTWAYGISDRLRHGSRATVVKLWDMGNRECLRFRRLL